MAVRCLTCDAWIFPLDIKIVLPDWFHKRIWVQNGHSWYSICVFKSRNVLPEWEFAWKIKICIVSLVYIYQFGGLAQACALIYYTVVLMVGNSNCFAMLWLWFCTLFQTSVLFLFTQSLVFLANFLAVKHICRLLRLRRCLIQWGIASIIWCTFYIRQYKACTVKVIMLGAFNFPPSMF